MKLLGSAKKKKNVDKDGGDVPKLESAEVVLVHCNLVNKSYHKASKVLFTFLPNKQFDQWITILSDSLTILNTTSTDFNLLNYCFTDQNNGPPK